MAQNDKSGFALSVTYAECVWIMGELLCAVLWCVPWLFGFLDVSHTKACPNKINVFVLFLLGAGACSQVQQC